MTTMSTARLILSSRLEDILSQVHVTRCEQDQIYKSGDLVRQPSEIVTKIGSKVVHILL